jgi:PAS domain-containing protein
MTPGRHAREQIGDWHAWLQLAQKAGLRIGLWDWNVSNNVVTWSEETYRQFGFTRDTFSGRLEDALARIHPQDRSRV